MTATGKTKRRIAARAANSHQAAVAIYHAGQTNLPHRANCPPIAARHPKSCKSEEETGKHHRAEKSVVVTSANSSGGGRR